MDKKEFEQWIYRNYTIGKNPMARELLSNVLDYAEGNERTGTICLPLPDDTAGSRIYHKNSGILNNINKIYKVL